MENNLAINSCFSQNKQSNYLIFMSEYRVNEACGLTQLTQHPKSHYHSTFPFNANTVAHPTKQDHSPTQMVAIDRMKSIDKFIADIAYNHNHTLSILSNYVYGCIRRLESKEYNADELIDSLKKVNQHSKNLTDILLNLKNLTSNSIYRYELVCLNHLITDTLRLMHYETLEFPVQIQFDVRENLPWVKVDKMHFQQAILNLTCNAIEAMRDAGIEDAKLSIEIAITGDLEEHLEVAVCDNGPGFDYEQLIQLFKSGFTTKPYANGLGLTVTKTIIENHGGQLSAQLNREGGACFKLTIPTQQ
jgi:signal transduction histidine kinase